ncbi:unknown [Firmicutes bacterium CAG:791]|nr:unknown [Firmicutes bacterium CAG:791]
MRKTVLHFFRGAAVQKTSILIEQCNELSIEAGEHDALVHLDGDKGNGLSVTDPDDGMGERKKSGFVVGWKNGIVKRRREAFQVCRILPGKLLRRDFHSFIGAGAADPEILVKHGNLIGKKVGAGVKVEPYLLLQLTDPLAVQRIGIQKIVVELGIIYRKNTEIRKIGKILIQILKLQMDQLRGGLVLTADGILRPPAVIGKGKKKRQDEKGCCHQQGKGQPQRCTVHQSADFRLMELSGLSLLVHADYCIPCKYKR